MGDVMIGRTVDEMISKRGYAYPWGDLLPLLKTTDVNIINLETTLTNSKDKVEKVFNFKATPDKINTLELASISIACLANNHILDYAEAGLQETIAQLDRANIKHTGAGKDQKAASSSAACSVKGVRLSVLNYTDNEPGWKAAPGKPGTNYIDVSDPSDSDKVFQEVAALREETDLLIVSLHWGPNLGEEPPLNFVDFAHELVRHGADIVYGHSAHVFQRVELFKQKLIFYDTGDFVDDYAVHPHLRNDRSFLYLVEATKHSIVGLKLVPVLISNCQVNKAEKKVADWCLKKMRSLSAPFGTEINSEGIVQIIRNAVSS